MTTIYYYANAFDSTYLQWVVYGSSPYLGAVDFPANYSSLGVGTHKREGIWDFPDAGAESGETLTKVELEVYSIGTVDPDLGGSRITAYVFDGSTWTLFNFAVENGYWSWKTVDITSKIDTWAKLNACRVYLQGTNLESQTLSADCLRLKATTVAVGIASKRLLVGVGV